MTENYDEKPPDQSQLELWADTYAHTFPVVSDGERYIHSYGVKGKGNGELAVKLPSFTLLGPGAKIIAVNKDYTEAAIEAALPKGFTGTQ